MSLKAGGGALKTTGLWSLMFSVAMVEDVYDREEKWVLVRCDGRQVS
jgi:hypothetical protein